MAAHGNVADQVDGLEHPCERLLLASLDSDLRRRSVRCLLRYEMVQRDAREAMTPREFVRAFLIDHGFKLSDRRADDARDWAPSWLYANRA